jgi:hypothetical protein
MNGIWGLKGKRLRENWPTRRTWLKMLELWKELDTPKSKIFSKLAWVERS